MPGQLKIEFLGTRGAFPLNLPETQELGTETTSVIITSTGGERLILDAGTGLNKLTPSIDDDIILLSHFHYDHVLGLPYFLMRKKSGRLRLVTSCAQDLTEFSQKLGRIFGGIGFPVGLSEIYRDLELVVIDSYTMSLHLQSWRVDAIALNHPGQAFGYRIRHAEAEATLCYLMDHEHGSDKDESILEFARHADLIIYDAAYDDSNYPRHRGFGHSTIETGCQFRRQAQAKSVALMGHSMERLDADKKRIEATLTRPHEILAHDRLTLSI